MNPLLLIGIAAVGAYFLFGSGNANASPAPPPPLPPSPVPPVPPLPTPVNGGSIANSPAMQQAAAAMVNGLQSHGYKKCDQALYQAVQGLAGLTTDGYPGPETIQAVNDAMYAMTGIQNYVSDGSTQGLNLPIYPWHSVTADGASGQYAYDGANAPQWADWNGACA